MERDSSRKKMPLFFKDSAFYIADGHGSRVSHRLMHGGKIDCFKCICEGSACFPRCLQRGRKLQN